MRPSYNLDWSINFILIIILVNDIKFKVVLKINFDGTHSKKLQDIIKESDFNLPLIKQISNSLKIKNNMAIYPQILDNWYKSFIEKFHMSNLDYKLMDLSLKNKNLKFIKVMIQLTKDELINYKTLIIKYKDVFT